MSNSLTPNQTAAKISRFTLYYNITNISISKMNYKNINKYSIYSVYN